MPCKQICLKLKVSKPGNGSHYKAGHKRCQICDLFINFSGSWCPCCGFKLRTGTRNAYHKSTKYPKFRY